MQGLHLRSLIAPEELPSGDERLYLSAIEDKPKLLAIAGPDGDEASAASRGTPKKPRRGGSSDDVTSSQASAASRGTPGSRKQDPEAASPTAAAAETPHGGAGVKEEAIDDANVVPPLPSRA